MADHTKWSKIKRPLGELDARRGKILSRPSKETSVGSRAGGGIPAFPPRLRTAIATLSAAPKAKKGGEREELTRDREQFVITPPPDQLYSVAEALKTAGIEPESPKLTFPAENPVAVTDEPIAAQVPKLFHALDDLDDVMNVPANFDISESTLAKRPAA